MPLLKCSREFVYFAVTRFVAILQNLLFSHTFYKTVANNGLREPYLLLTIARLYCFRMSHAQGMLSKFRRKNLKANLMSSTHALLSDKASCSSQSEGALYGKFIIKYATQHLCLLFFVSVSLRFLV